MARALLLFAPIAAHYLWLQRAADKAVVTFSENPGGAGVKLFIEMVEKRTTARLGVAPARPSPLPLALQSTGALGALGELVSPSLPSLTTAVLEGDAVWGVFPELNKTAPPLLKYWFSAHQARPGHEEDWTYIDANSENRLQVTLRQGPCDGNGTAPATVVTQFDKQRLAAVEVSLFTAKGRSGSVTTSESGEAALALPAGEPAFVLAQHWEHAPGQDAGKAYEMVAHFATHTAYNGCSKAPSEAPTSLVV